MGQRDNDYFRIVAAGKMGVAVDELDQLKDGVAELDRDEAIAKEGMAAELEEARQEVGFSARLLVQATLPHSKPKPGLWRRPT